MKHFDRVEKAFNFLFEEEQEVYEKEGFIPSGFSDVKGQAKRVIRLFIEGGIERVDGALSRGLVRLSFDTTQTVYRILTGELS